MVSGVKYQEDMVYQEIIKYNEFMVSERYSMRLCYQEVMVSGVYGI